MTDWSRPALRRQLGQRPDAEIAAELGLTAGQVSRVRRSLGVPLAPSARRPKAAAPPAAWRDRAREVHVRHAALVLAALLEEPRSLDELAELTGRTRRTVYRLFEWLKKSGLVIEYDEGRGVYVLHAGPCPLCGRDLCG